MKKLLVIPFLAALFFASCKKNTNTVSQLVTYSEPTITINGSQFYSIPVGGSLPTISATAYDSFYQTSYPVVIDQSSLDNTVPGLNIVYIKSTNKYGMIGSKGVFVAVTDVDPAMDLSGTYARTSPSAGPNFTVTELANGLYRTDNVAGTSTAAFIVPAYFVQIDATTISLPLQETPSGSLYGEDAALSLTPGDTTISYSIQGNSSFGTYVRTFTKQ